MKIELNKTYKIKGTDYYNGCKIFIKEFAKPFYYGKLLGGPYADASLAVLESELEEIGDE